MHTATGPFAISSYLFTWKAVFRSVTLGVAAVTAAFSWLDSLWGNLCFLFAYLSIIITAISIAGVLIKNRVSPAKCRAIYQATKKDRHPVWIGDVKIGGLKLLIVFVALGVGIGLWCIVHVFQIRFELSFPEGILYPANDPMPNNQCLSEIADHEAAILTGGNIYIVGSFPNRILKIQGQDRFIISKSEDGAILVTLDIFDSQERAVAQIVNGEFKYKQEWLFTWKRDRHTLELFDFQNKRILKIRYLNKQVIQLDAVLRYPGTSSVVILEGSKTSIAPGDGVLTNMCLRKIGNGGPIIEIN